MAEKHATVQVRGTEAERRGWRIVAMENGVQFGLFVRRAIEFAIKNPDRVLRHGDRSEDNNRA